MTDKDVISKICNFAYIMGIVGVCTLGICPAFAMMAIAVCVVVKNKNVSLSQKDEKKLKIAKILSIISLVLFAADIIIASLFVK